MLSELKSKTKEMHRLCALSSHENMLTIAHHICQALRRVWLIVFRLAN